MLNTYFGEFAALLTAVFWTITALAFEDASKKIGSLSVNLLRLLVSFAFYCLLSFILTGNLLPLNIDSDSWFWLILSGFVGVVFGDYFLFKSYEIISARISMLIMALVPPITALIGWLVLDEELGVKNIFAMFITIGGISFAILERGTPKENNNGKKRRSVQLSYSLTGVLLAFGGALGQSGGLILSKIGMKDYDPFAASQIRILAGIVGFVVWFSFARHWKKLYFSLKNRKAMIGIIIGSFFGPFLGISFSLTAIQHTSIGIASTIMSIMPVLIIVPAIFIFKHKVNFREIIGAIVAVLGVALFFVEL